MVSRMCRYFINFVDQSGLADEYAQESSAEEKISGIYEWRNHQNEKDAFVIFYLKGDNGILNQILLDF